MEGCSIVPDSRNGRARAQKAKQTSKITGKEIFSLEKMNLLI